MMRQTKAIVFTAIITLLTLGTVLYSSCKKDHCKTLNCQHGGTCNDGFCTCPTGYTGTYCQVANTANIILKNKTYSKVYLTINGVNYTIDTGSALTFTGGYADSMKITGFAHGAYGINVPVQAAKVSYPLSGTSVQEINVPKEYFFLRVINTNPTVPIITQVRANYMQRDETLDVVQIPNNGIIFYVGYYKAYNDTHVRLSKDPTFIDYHSLGLPGTVNQVYTAVFP